MELRNCPFCGGSAEFERIGTRNQSCIVACQDCGCSMQSNEEGDRNGVKWNTRVQDNHSEYEPLNQMFHLIQEYPGGPIKLKPIEN